MKRLAALLLLGLSLGWLTGCPAANAPTPPLAPGYLNPQDQTMGETLAAAHAFYVRIQTDSAAGKVTLTPAEKAAFNALGTTINVAQATYIAFHNGQVTEAQAQGDVNAVSSQMAAIQAQGVK